MLTAHHKYGWWPDLPDFRDIRYDHSARFAKLNGSLPPYYTLISGFPVPYDQGNLGSCTANAGAGTVQFLQKKEGMHVFMPSRLFIYYYERALEGTIGSDAGATLRDSMKVLAAMGAPPESMWPYVESQFTWHPSPQANMAGKKDLITSYLSISQQLPAMKMCLADGFPINVGFTVFASFESDIVAQTGVVPIPQSNEEILGGHAVVVVGYFDNGHVPAPGNPTHPSGGYFQVRNSWGPQWGDAGYFYLPYGYLTDPYLSDDFWSARLVVDTD
jgi:C1A family cysteine protease